MFVRAEKADTRIALEKLDDIGAALRRQEIADEHPPPFGAIDPVRRPFRMQLQCELEFEFRPLHGCQERKDITATVFKPVEFEPLQERAVGRPNVQIR